MIQVFCNRNKIEYKQGINEIVAPFLLLSYYLNLSFDDSYMLFEAFISKYAMGYYHNKDVHFSNLKSSMYLLGLLLKYHEPSVASLFERESIQPELYSMCWFITIFANKSQLDIVYHIWNVIIINDDPLLIHFLLLSLIVENKQMLFALEKTEMLCLLSKLSIKSIEQCNKIIQQAFDFQSRTPYSFKMLYVHPDIFQTNEQDINSRKIDPEGISIMPLFPYEFIHLCLKKQFIDFSYNSKAIRGKWKDNIDSYCYRKSDVNNNEISQTINDNGNELSAIPYLIFDLRSNGIESVIISKSIFIPGDFCEENNRENFLKLIKKDKGSYHIILLTSETSYFKNIKQGKNYSEEKVTQYMLFEIIQELLLDNEFPYVSYVYCGFKAVHELIISSYIQFPNHFEDKCSLCLKKKKRLNILSKLIFDSKENGLTIENYSSITKMPLINLFSTCTLINFNCKSYVNLPSLVILNDHVITIYSKAMTMTKKSKAIFEYRFSYWFTDDVNQFHATYNNQYDNIVTLYFTLNDLKGRYENTLMIDFADKKDSRLFYNKIMQKKKNSEFFDKEINNSNSQRKNNINEKNNNQS